ncbi:MAG: hypothetical protein HRT66_08645 [Flavobacteriaceae bacterium]|nr:hypothetical protein [Flavobacteriaceae bacterium]
MNKYTYLTQDENDVNGLRIEVKSIVSLRKTSSGCTIELNDGSTLEVYESFHYVAGEIS